MASALRRDGQILYGDDAGMEMAEKHGHGRQISRSVMAELMVGHESGERANMPSLLVESRPTNASRMRMSPRPPEILRHPPVMGLPLVAMPSTSGIDPSTSKFLARL
jgi:hypothetical protein